VGLIDVVAVWRGKAWLKAARKGEKAEGSMQFVKALDGNNRIIALVILLLVGAVHALFGVDLQQYADVALKVMGFDGAWLLELGVSAKPSEVTFAAYSLFAILNAVRKKGR
jgi:hypothetical protein